MPDPFSITSLALQVLSLVSGGMLGRDRRLVLEVEHGFAVHDFTPDGLGEIGIAIHATNDGRRPIVLESAGLTTDRGKAILPTEQFNALPRRLTEGDKQSFWFEIPSLIQVLKRHADQPDLPRIGWVKDSAGREYRKKVSKNTRLTVKSHWIPD